MLKIKLIFVCLIFVCASSGKCSNFESCKEGEPKHKVHFLDQRENDNKTKNKKAKTVDEREYEKIPNVLSENKNEEVCPNFKLIVKDFLETNSAEKFNNIINSDVKDNIKVAREYAIETLATIEEYLKVLTNIGIKYFSYEDFKNKSQLKEEEILLRLKRTRLYKSMYKSAEDLYFLEQEDPQAVEIAILFYLEEAYIMELVQRNNSLNQAAKLYFNFQSQENKKFQGNGLSMQIGQNSILERDAYNAAVRVLDFRQKFGSIFQNIKMEIDFVAIQLFVEKYEEFIKPFGKEFNPFYGYPRNK